MAPAAVALLRRSEPRARRRRRDRARPARRRRRTCSYEILRAAGRRPGLLDEHRAARRRRRAARPALNTPEAIDLQRLFREMVDAGNAPCAMEATSHASVQGRLDGVRFAVLVFTNLAHEHLDFHGTMEEYFAAKRRLFAQAERAVVNVGDAWGRRLAAELADAIVFDADRDALDADLKLRGRFNLENALGGRGGGARARRRRGRDPRRASKPSTAFPGGSSSSTRASRSRVIVDYAHKPASLERVLREARAAERRPRHLRLRLRRRPRPREAPAHGTDRARARRRRDRHVRQPAQRGSARDHRRDRRRRAGARGRARPARGDRKGDRSRPRRRRRADRRARATSRDRRSRA